ncbi:MAG TPA: hypothetical protein VE999_07140 [Gemmataceae bacterium]|nr:hypothetical protein [Gemmataceae bacterium]
MLSSILRTGTERRIVLRGARWWCLPVCLLVLTMGCGKGVRHSAEHGEVSGDVTYKGKPVTGGAITFVADDGFTSNDRIDETGHYTIKPPVGPVKITIDNRMLTQRANPNAMKGAGPRPGGSDPNPIKGKYVRIPDKYYKTTDTPLTYTVKKGSQTYNIELTD